MKVVPIKIKDINFKSEWEKTDVSFRILIDNFILEKPSLHNDINWPRLTEVIESFDFRADKPYLFTHSHSKVTGLKVAHTALHYFLAKKFGSRLMGRPHYILLCEAIASMSDYYFWLEEYRMFGATKHFTEMISPLITGTRIILGDKKGNQHVFSMLESKSEKESFRKFREATFAMFKNYEYLYKLAERRQSGKPANYPKIHQKIKKNKYGPLIYYFKLGNNVMFAVLNGQKKTRADQKTVQNCIKLLKKANSFVHFLQLLGITKIASKAA